MAGRKSNEDPSRNCMVGINLHYIGRINGGTTLIEDEKTIVFNPASHRALSIFRSLNKSDMVGLVGVGFLACTGSIKLCRSGEVLAVREIVTEKEDTNYAVRIEKENLVNAEEYNRLEQETMKYGEEREILVREHDYLKKKIYDSHRCEAALDERALEEAKRGFNVTFYEDGETKINPENAARFEDYVARMRSGVYTPEDEARKQELDKLVNDPFF